MFTETGEKFLYTFYRYLYSVAVSVLGGVNEPLIYNMYILMHLQKAESMFDVQINRVKMRSSMG